ncbi:MAG: hypothetical protein SFW08_04340 [Gemmatimonadaceae bacterium]|nr:hypothetical protein [Gemmatimonadaceae bacterium]
MRQQRAGAEGQDYRVKIGTDGIKVTEVGKAGNGGLSGSEVEALQAQVATLTSRVDRLKEERTELSEQLSSGELSGPAIGATAERLNFLTQQLGATEAQLTQVEDKLAAAGVTPAPAVTFEGVPAIPFDPNVQRDIPENVLVVTIVSIIFVAMPMAVAIARWIWKRSTGSSAPQKADLESAQRLARMEQAVDSIALELERVSEGQRFVTRILSENRALGAGAAEPLAVPASEKVQAR